MTEYIPSIPILSEGNERLLAARDRFRGEFTGEPEFYARAPGRVNLIGEHIDYCGYSVLPMAIEQDITVAASAAEDITLINVDSGYGSYTSTVSQYVIDRSGPQWYHYFLCGYKGIVEWAQRQGRLDSPITGLHAVINGNIPPSAGLSSSSALVCAAAMVTMKLLGLNITKVQMADICASCEQYIGTIGGGMDQAISFLAQKGTAKHISFNPIRTEDVVLPPGVVFVISNCLEESNKAAGPTFNTRVVECRLGCQLVAKSLGLAWKSLRRFADLQKVMEMESSAELLKVAEQFLHKELYTKSEICSLLEVTPEELLVTSLSENTASVETFYLHQRATHVLNEASLVSQFNAMCQRGGEGTAQDLGRLMDASHSSCSNLYECSTSNLDRLVAICKSSGALGSRLTGAGWGGCAVSLLREDAVTEFLTKVKTEFYDTDPVKRDKVTQSLFSTQPGPGALFYV